jgi:hypothetical protein
MGWKKFKKFLGKVVKPVAAIAAIAFPPLIPAIGAALGATGAAATVVGAAALSAGASLASGDSLKEALTAGAVSGLTAGLLGPSASGGGGGASALDAGMGVYPTSGISEAVGGLSALDAGMSVYPSTGDIGASALDAGMNVYPSTGTVGDIASSATPSGLSLSGKDALRIAGVVASAAGANELANSGTSGSGTGGFDIVPIPADWRSPPPTTVAEFTPLAPIDFGNAQMLQGTQWERLLSPTYNQPVPMPNPAVSTTPSNMSFEELTRILGGSKASIPTQNLTINDVIAGIQSQYGQAPKSAMG